MILIIISIIKRYKNPNYNKVISLILKQIYHNSKSTHSYSFSSCYLCANLRRDYQTFGIMSRLSSITWRFMSTCQDTGTSVNLHSTLQLQLNTQRTQATSQQLKIVTENSTGCISLTLCSHTVDLCKAQNKLAPLYPEVQHANIEVWQTLLITYPISKSPFFLNLPTVGGGGGWNSKFLSWPGDVVLAMEI